MPQEDRGGLRRCHPMSLILVPTRELCLANLRECSPPLISPPFTRSLVPSPHQVAEILLLHTGMRAGVIQSDLLESWVEFGNSHFFRHNTGRYHARANTQGRASKVTKAANATGRREIEARPGIFGHVPGIYARAGSHM